MSEYVEEIVDKVMAAYESSDHGTRREMNRILVEKVALYQWAIEKNNLTIQRNSTLGQDPWSVLDVDGVILGQGDGPIAAIIDARANIGFD